MRQGVRLLAVLAICAPLPFLIGCGRGGDAPETDRVTAPVPAEGEPFRVTAPASAQGEAFRATEPATGRGRAFRAPNR